MNKTLLSMMGTLTSEKKVDWKTYLPQLVHAYNATRHASTGYSPYFLMFGREIRLPLDVIQGLSSPVDEEPSHAEYVRKLRKRLQYAYALASRENKKASARQKKHFDMKVRGPTVQVGDRVLLRKLGVKGKHKIDDETRAYLVLE
jgi:uncharacterized protein YdeI (YjbR/CyaY-like superfamily)